MKWKELKEILDEHYPPEGAMVDDSFGEIIEISNNKNIEKIMVSLDVTLDVIAQAKKNNVQLIISHHPFWWGDKEKAFNKSPYLKSIYDLLVSQKIGLYVIHTNADFASNSIAYMQGLAIDLENLEQNDGNYSVTGYLKKTMSLKEVVNLFKRTLFLEDVELRSNVDPNVPIKKITISSGTSGSYGINENDSESLYVVGEVKHHEWVKANQLNLKLLELSHFSESIFKHMIKVILDNEDVKVILAKENNGYKII